jgi:lipopolysaccharide biosynthesis regulator YciM
MQAGGAGERLMRRSWLDRVLGRADTEEVRKELAALARAEEWEALLQLANTALKQLPDDGVVLNHAARARLETATQADLSAAVEEARTWLATALDGDPGDVEALYLSGLVEFLAGRMEAAEAAWQRAWQADDTRTAARDGLIRVWTTVGRVPDWGVPVVERALADAPG